MNLGELRTAVRLRASVPSTDGVWTDDYVNGAINEAIQLIGQEQPWPWLENVETDTSPADPIDLSAISPVVRDIRSVTVDNYHAAHQVPIGDLDRWRALTDQYRYVFSTWADDLTIRPAPAADATVTIRYYRDEPTLSDDADEPLMPAAYHPAIVHMAVALGFEGLDDPSSAGVHEARARRVVAMMERTALRKVRGPGRVHVRSGSEY